ncbi:phage tail-collar fiber domain-containing protein [Proteus mirabilis]|uniref:phage tail-collar fiber domain-containing protein n=1 Tax=Proteus mirabilis TaxID=584 RepID=UPI003315E45A
MSQSAITLAFERWKASATEAQQPVILDEFVLANVPNLDPSKPIDRNEGLPDAKYIMHRQAVNKTGVVNQNAVAYSVTIGAEIGDFDFNWIGLLNKQSGTVAMIVHAPTQRKIKTQAGQQGNVLTRSFLLEYLGASKETAITTPAEMWQIDFTARLSGIDEMQRLINRDKYGVASFFNNGFLVAKAGNQFYITKGLGYIEGLRAELAENKNITVMNQATKVWVDVSYQGNITSDWGVHIAITVKPDLKNYTDNAGFAHFVFAVASISVTGVITDLRPKGTLDAQYFEDALKKHEQSRNHPDATTTVKGFTKLNNQVGDSENTALTPYGAKKELEKYQPKGNYQPAGNYVTTATFNLEINKKIDKASLSQQLGNDVNKVPSLDLVTKELGGKQPKGNYADKSSSSPQNFTGAIESFGGGVIASSAGKLIALKATDNEITIEHRLSPGNTRKFILQDKSGTAALLSDVESSELVPHPIPWSLPTAPSGYLICQGQTFNKATYPKLAIAYQSGRLPDLRGEFIRGLDTGRGIDAGREVLSSQSGNSLLSAMWRGTVTEQKDWENKTSYSVEIGTNNSGYFTIGQQIEGQNGNETRPRNIAFLYIVRAA